MEVLMPSEIARLVYGYLKKEGCDEAAKTFLETSSNLQEGRLLVSQGTHFVTVISDMCLVELLQKYWMASNMIHERLNQNSDVGVVKRTRDIVEQLKILFGGARSQRIVVNINVPSQNGAPTPGDSPIVLTSYKKRRHSNNIDRERQKRVKTGSQDKTFELISSQNSATTEATPLESLPGHVELKKPVVSSTTTAKSPLQFLAAIENIEKLPEKSLVKEKTFIITETETAIASVSKETPNKCTMGTSTEELCLTSCAEVQTMPFYVSDSAEFEMNHEPIENLSLNISQLMLGGMLGNADFQESFADNINKALGDVSGSEANTTMSKEFNSRIKDVAAVIERDPVIEKMLNDIIGVYTEETDTSPDEDNDVRMKKSPEESQQIVRSAETENGEVAMPNALEDQNAAAVNGIMMINANITKEVNATDDLREKEEIQASEMDNCSKLPKTMTSEIAAQETATISENIDPPEYLASSEAPEIPIKKEVEKTLMNTVPCNISKSKTTKKSESKITTKKKTTAKTTESTLTNMNFVPASVLPKVQTVPTLVLWNEQNIPVQNIPMQNVQKQRSGNVSKYVRIAPKDPSKLPCPPIKPICLKAVEVPEKIAPPQPVVQQITELPTIETKFPARIKQPIEIISKLSTSEASASIHPIPKKPPSKKAMSEPMETARISDMTDILTCEPVTLYGNENSAGLTLETVNMPLINLDESINFGRTGLSPFLKFNTINPDENNIPAVDTEQVESKTAVDTTTETANAQTSAGTKLKDDIFTKRTPKSIMKSRTKNHRFSSSTPRRRSNHVRALDFNTPLKMSSSGKIMPGSEGGKLRNRMCRASLFKSPPFSGNGSFSSPKLKKAVKVCQPCRVPIATRSPAPKLIGGWDNYTGVGAILGSMSSRSSSSTSPSPSKMEVPKNPSRKKSWDADLRESLVMNEKKQLVIYQLKTNQTELIKEHNNPEKSITSHQGEKNKQQIEKLMPVKSSQDGNAKLKLVKSEEIEDKKEPVKSSQKDEKKEQKEKLQNTDVAEKVATRAKDPEAEKKNVSAKSSATNVPLKSSDSKPVEKKPVKKYAKLKTISSNVTKIQTESVEDATLTRAMESVKASLEVTQYNFPLPNIMNLETPQKLDNLPDIPPTPRLVTPGSSTLSNFLKLSDDSSKVQNFITSTPGLPPPTPYIKQIGENIGDVTSKGYESSLYYLGQSISVEELKFDGALQKNVESTVPTEITQFEVIKENLPMEEAAKELKISVTPKESESHRSITSTPLISAGTVPVSECTLSSNENMSDSSSESSDNDSSSSSNSSSNSSSSSCSTCTNESDSPMKSLHSTAKKKKTRKSHKDESRQNDSSRLSIRESVQDETLGHSKAEKMEADNDVESEASPLKVFALDKPMEVEEAAINETPAKDEAVLAEANISETPSSSKAGVDTSTNLSSKISEIINTGNINSSVSTSEDAMHKLKIVSVKNVCLPVDPVLVPSISAMNWHLSMDAQLEETRKRVKNKLQRIPPTPLVKGSRKKSLNSKNPKPSVDSSNIGNRIEILENCKNDLAESVEEKKKIPEKVDHNFAKPISKDDSNVVKKPENIEKTKISEVTVEEKKSDDIPKKGNNKADKPKRGKKKVLESSTAVEKDGAKEMSKVELDNENLTDNEKGPTPSGSRKKLHEVSEDPKAAMKLKIEQIKRDLFSDEESSDKMTTRSKSRQILDAQKDVASSSPGVEKQDTVKETPQRDAPTAELPGVLECLQLVPANKSDLSQTGLCDDYVEIKPNHAMFKFTYDEENQVRRRYKKFTSSDLQMEAMMMDENEEVQTRLYTATDYEEIFNCNPVKKKKTVQRKEPLKIIKQVRKRAPKLANSELVFKDEPLKPLATSSPSFKNMLSSTFQPEAGTANENVMLDLTIKKKSEDSSSKKTVGKRNKKVSAKEDEPMSSDNGGDLQQKEALQKVDVEHFLADIYGSAESAT